MWYPVVNWVVKVGVVSNYTPPPTLPVNLTDRRRSVFLTNININLVRGWCSRFVPGAELLDVEVNIPTKNSNRV